MSAKQKMKLDVPETLIVHSCNLQLGKTIGQGMHKEESYREQRMQPPFVSLSGEFGIVYKALLKRSFAEGFTETVAVKTLKGKIHFIGDMKIPLTIIIYITGWPPQN